MIIRLKKGEVVFRNPDIFAVDTKMVNLDRVMTNLFMQIYSAGAPVSLAVKTEHNIESLIKYVNNLEDKGLVSGAKSNPDAVEDWLRSDLLELVNRGNVVKEKVSSLRPMHLMSFRIQNRKYCRHYNTADQLYMMLKSNPGVLSELKDYLRKGWDLSTNSMVGSEALDVDTTGILYLTKELKDKKGLNTETKDVKPFLENQTELFNDDIRRLLEYKDKLPRTVFIEYLKILCGFHLALYTMKLVYLLPKMVDAGTKDVEDDWSLVVDMTDNLDSAVSPYACKDAEYIANLYRSYVRSTFVINLCQNRLRASGSNASVENAIAYAKNELKKDDSYYEFALQTVRNGLEDDDARKEFDEILQYFDNNDYFDKYVHLLEKSNLGTTQYKYLGQFIDAVTMKNTTSMLFADSRSKRHPRRGVLGSKLLETLVQLLLLQKDENGAYHTKSMSIDEITKLIRDRYGLIINGISEPRFANADVMVHYAFKVNNEAFKDKLRQIGFYTDLSDACILQKIRPRYNI